MKVTQHHVYRQKLHNTVSVTNLLTLNQTEWLINRLTSSFLKVFIHWAAILIRKLEAVKDFGFRS